MNPVQSYVLLVSALLLVIFICGLLLSRSGKPYSTLVFTVHKLASVAILIARARLYSVFSSYYGVSGFDIPMLPIGAFAGLLILCAMVTGGLISSKREFPDFVYLLHRVFSLLSLIFQGVALYLIINYSGPST